MSWISTLFKTIHLTVLLLVCALSLYTLTAKSEVPSDSQENQSSKSGALSIVSSENTEDDGFVQVDTSEEIVIENAEKFIPTKEWQKVKKGQAIPRGLHVRMNIQTGDLEAKLMDDNTDAPLNPGNGIHLNIDMSQGTEQVDNTKYTREELKEAVKTMKSENIQHMDMETLKEKKKFQSYEELKKAFEEINASIKTDAEIVTELVQVFQGVSQTEDDVSGILNQLEYYLHQIDNAMLFCDLGAMPLLLRCLNNTRDTVRSEAALTLGSALQSNPKVQVQAIESGAMRDVLRVLATDPSPSVRKRALFALSTMIRHFPFAQKRFLELGGLSVLGKLLESDSAENLQVRVVTLLTDLVKEKDLHTEHSDREDPTQMERLRQYGEINLQKAVVEGGWCRYLPVLLRLQDHDSREKVMVAMDTLLPDCYSTFRSALPLLRSLQAEYERLSQEEQKEQQQGDTYFQGLLATTSGLVQRLSETREEL